MATDPHPKPSFSPYRRWSIGFQVFLLVLVVLSVVVMANYISRDFFLRFSTSTRSGIELSPRTLGFLRTLTNQVNVTLYYDTEDEDGQALYSIVADLLGEYRRGKSRGTVSKHDYMNESGLAQKVKAKY